MGARLRVLVCTLFAACSSPKESEVPDYPIVKINSQGIVIKEFDPTRSTFVWTKLGSKEICGLDNLIYPKTNGKIEKVIDRRCDRTPNLVRYEDQEFSYNDEQIEYWGKEVFDSRNMIKFLQKRLNEIYAHPSISSARQEWNRRYTSSHKQKLSGHQ